MKKTKDLAVLTIVFATLAALTSSIFAQHQDLPADGPDRPVLGELPHFPLEIYEKNPVGVTVETFLTGLDVVWGLEFAPDGRLFITEKAGRIRIVDADGRLDTRFARDDLVPREVQLVPVRRGGGGSGGGGWWSDGKC